MTKKGTRGKSSSSSSSKGSAPGRAAQREAFEGVEPDAADALERFVERGRGAQAAVDELVDAPDAAELAAGQRDPDRGVVGVIEPPPTDDLGPCCICGGRAIVEVHWPAAAPERYCANDGELALAGKVVPESRRPRKTGGGA